LRSKKVPGYHALPHDQINYKCLPSFFSFDTLSHEIKRAVIISQYYVCVTLAKIP